MLENAPESTKITTKSTHFLLKPCATAHKNFIKNSKSVQDFLSYLAHQNVTSLMEEKTATVKCASAYGLSSN